MSCEKNKNLKETFQKGFSRNMPLGRLMKVLSKGNKENLTVFSKLLLDKHPIDITGLEGTTIYYFRASSSFLKSIGKSVKMIHFNLKQLMGGEIPLNNLLL